MTNLVKSGSEKSLGQFLDSLECTTELSNSDNCADLQSTECALSQIIDNRMLDPDAMIESLDRFTAELISHSSHLEKKESKFVESSHEGGNNTWNEDPSSNDITFPSLSGSIPNVITFQSERNNIQEQPVDVLDGKS